MIKLIATDLDGTLLNENGQLHPDFNKVFKALKSKNVKFVAASGRQYANIIKTFKDIKDDMFFVSDNGTFMVCDGKETVISFIDRDKANEIIEIARNIKETYIILACKKCAYIENKDTKFINELEKYFEDYKIVDDLTKVEDEILKVTLCDFLGSENNSNKYFDDYREDLQISISGEFWLDLSNKGANKGVAIEKIQNMLNISDKETMVFGDQLNDVEMMGRAYHSYAMENAHDKLKKVARFKAKKNTENGVVEKIKEIMEIYV